MHATTKTAGQNLTAEIRKMWALGPRTRWGRANGRTRFVNREYMLSDIRDATGEYRGIESERRTAILDTASTALHAWHKFVANYRIDGVLRYKITELTPWQFAGFLGEMTDSGCTNMGEFELWFQRKAREVNAAKGAA